MANTSKISGFRPVKHVNGSPYSGQAEIFATATGDGTALFVGDPVILAGSADSEGVATVQRAAAGAAVLGVVVGVINTKLDPVGGKMSTGSVALDTPQYRVASTATYVLVCTDPSVVYETELTTGGSAYTYLVADVGLNMDGYYATGSTTTGVSACALDASTKATTATLQFKLLGAVPRPDNERVTGSSTAVKVYAKINNASMGNGTGATGQ